MKWRGKVYYPKDDSPKDVYEVLKLREINKDYRTNPCFHDKDDFQNGYGISLFPVKDYVRKSGVHVKAHFQRYNDVRNKLAIKKLHELTGAGINSTKYFNNTIRVRKMIANLKQALSENPETGVSDLKEDMEIETFEIGNLKDQYSRDFIIKHQVNSEEPIIRTTRIFIREYNRNHKFEPNNEDFILNITKWEDAVVESWSLGKPMFMKFWRNHRNRRINDYNEEKQFRNELSDLEEEIIIFENEIESLISSDRSLVSTALKDARAALLDRNVPATERALDRVAEVWEKYKPEKLRKDQQLTPNQELSVIREQSDLGNNVPSLELSEVIERIDNRKKIPETFRKSLYRQDNLSTNQTDIIRKMDFITSPSHKGVQRGKRDRSPKDVMKSVDDKKKMEKKRSFIKTRSEVTAEDKILKRVFDEMMRPNVRIKKLMKLQNKLNNFPDHRGIMTHVDGLESYIDVFEMKKTLEKLIEYQDSIGRGLNS